MIFRGLRTTLGGFCAVIVAGCVTWHAAPRAPSALRVECATASVAGLRWSKPGWGSSVSGYRILRNGEVVGTSVTQDFSDTSVGPSTRYEYVVVAFNAAGKEAASAPITLTTNAASPDGDAPYCASPLIHSMTWDWAAGYNAAPGSDLWPVTWGKDGAVYAFFGDGGGFRGDNTRGRTSFGIAAITGKPPLTDQDEVNIYGGLDARYPSTISGKARSIIAVGADFYAIAGIYRTADAKAERPPPISGTPPHLEMIYSKGNAHSWQEASWTFCSAAAGSKVDPASETDPAGPFCPSGFVNFGRGNRGARDGYVYLYGNSNAADPGSAPNPDANIYLARVQEKRLLTQSAYEYFAGLDARAKPTWTAEPARMKPVFMDRNASQPGCGGVCSMAVSLEEAVYNVGLKRFIGVAQGNFLAQTSFYEAPDPWGPWTTISYQNIHAADGSGGWGNLGAAAGGSLGVHAINAWTSADGKTMWMVYSSDGKAPAEALFPPAGTALDSFNLLRVELK